MRKIMISAASQFTFQESHNKRKDNPHCDIEDNPKRTRFDVGDNDEPFKNVESRATYSEDNTYHKGGLVHSLHGVSYQLKLQMLFLKRALDHGYEFNLGTEVDDAEKFDDIVFKYKRKDDNEIDKIRFVQVKHKQDELKKITVNDLLKVNNGDFSLQKYFTSFCKIKRNSKFSKCILEDFIIYTNIDFADLETETASIKIKNIEEHDDILEITKSSKTTKLCKLVVPHDLYEKFRETSHLHILIKSLKQHIHENKLLQVKADIFKLYHNVLSKKVFHISSTQKATFRSDFLNGNNLSYDVSNFRYVLQSALKFNNDQFQKELSQKELNVSASFGQVLEFQTDPIITDPEGLAEKFAQIVYEARKKHEDVVTIERKADVIKSNVNKLAFHILVQDEAEKALIRFRKNFFDDNRKLEGNLEKFKAALKRILKKGFWALGQYKYKISEFNVCEETLDGELLYPKDILPNDYIEDSEIEEFFEKLVFAVNQPNEDELGRIVTNEIGESSKFNLLDANLVSDSFQKKLLDWFKEKLPVKGKEGVWLNAKSGQRFLKSIEQKVNGLISFGMSLAYLEKLAKCGIRFGRNNVFEKLKDFLLKEDVSKKILHVIASEETILSALNVYGALEILKREHQDEFALSYLKNDSYVFLNLSTLLEQRTQPYILDAFKSDNSHHLLIIDWEFDSSPWDIYALYNNLSDILRRANKKIVIIAKEHNKFIDQFAENFKTYVIDDTSFVDLTEESKEYILEKVITFQGQNIRFDKLIGNADEKAKEIIDKGIILKLLKGDDINISSLVKDPSEVNDYYINRRFRQVTFNKENIKKYLEENNSKPDLFVISGTDSGLKHNHIYVFDDPISAERRFNELCKQNTESNIHWLESDSINLTWYKSHGSISNLILYRIREKVNITDNTRPFRSIKELDLVREDNHQIVIISDTAGMGKSTVLTHLSKEFKKYFRNLWVIRINLNDHTKVLMNVLNSRKLKFTNQNINNVVEFLLNNLLASQVQSELERKLFINCFNIQGKIVFLFDGFDEISPDYKDVVIDLLRTLKKSKVKKIFVTTRPNMREELEQALEMFALVLEPFTKEEQIEFLCKFWTKKLNLKNLDQKHTKRLKTYAEFTITHISKTINDKEQEFIGIPLQAIMLAEVFQKNEEGLSSWQGCKDFLETELSEPKLPNDWTLLNLYEHFVKRKFYHIFLEGKKGRNLTKVGETKSAANKYNKFVDKYAMLSLQTLFNENELMVLLSQTETQELNSLIRDIQNGDHNEGIVDQIIDNKPHFIHRTFAEYFASFSIAKKMVTAPIDVLRCIDNVLLNTSPIFINSLIDQLDGAQGTITTVLQKPLLHFVSTINHPNFIKSLIASGYNDWQKKLDASGKTFLHYAFEYDTTNIVKELLEYANDIQEKTILKHGSFINPDYESSQLVKFINIQDNDNKTALYYAIRQNHIEYAFELLLKGASIDLLTVEYLNRLTYEMLFGKSVDFYNRDFLDYFNHENNLYCPIQEKLFLKAPCIFNKLKLRYQTAILSYFFKHGRVKVIDTLLGTITNLEQRKILLNRCDFYSPPLETVSYSAQISDDDKLETTKYIIEHGGTTMRSLKFYDNNDSSTSYDSSSDDDDADSRNILLQQEISLSPLQIVSKTKVVDSDVHKTASEVTYMPVLGVIEIFDNKTYITNILLTATVRGHIKTFQYFIAQENRRFYYLHVFEACKCNEYNIIKYMFENYKNDIIDEYGNNALHTACKHYINLKIIKYLLKYIDINATNDKGETPLFIVINARSKVNITLIKYLVSKGSDVNWEDVFGNTPLSCAVKNDQEDIIKYLLQNESRTSENTSQLIKDKVAFYKNPNQYNLDLVDENGYPRVHTAIKSNNFEWAKFLIRHGADVNKVDVEGKAPLHLDSVLIDKNFEIAHLLFQYGAIFNAKDSNNRTPHDLLSFSDNSKGKIKSLLDSLNKLFSGQNLGTIPIEVYNYGAKYARNTQGISLLHIAAATNDIEAMIWQTRDYVCSNLRGYRECISLDIKDCQGYTPLHFAAKHGHYKIVFFLLCEGAIFNSKNFQGETPEVLAKHHNHYNIIRMLQPTKNLFIAIENNNMLQVENYIFEQIFINAKNESGKTLLHLAAYFGNFFVVKLLIDDGADIEALDFNKNTPLHAATAEKDKFKTVKMLLRHGAIYNVKNSLNQSPLDLSHWQSRYLLGQIDTLFKDIQSDNPQVIINNLQMISKKNEIDISTIINVRDTEKNTLLHYAARSREFIIVEILLENGANYNAKNKLGYTPVRLTNDQNITTLLRTINDMFENVLSINEWQRQVNLKIMTNVTDCTRKGLLHYAAKSCNWEIVKFLVENGGKVNLTDIDYSEVKNGSEKLKLIKYLIDKGDINATNDKGETPLFIAICARSGLNVIEYLVIKGSDINSEDMFGNTPLSRAIEYYQENIINYLLKKGACVSDKDKSSTLHEINKKKS